MTMIDDDDDALDGMDQGSLQSSQVVADQQQSSEDVLRVPLSPVQSTTLVQSKLTALASQDPSTLFTISFQTYKASQRSTPPPTTTQSRDPLIEATLSSCRTRRRTSGQMTNDNVSDDVDPMMTSAVKQEEEDYKIKEEPQSTYKVKEEIQSTYKVKEEAQSTYKVKEEAQSSKRRRVASTIPPLVTSADGTNCAVKSETGRDAATAILIDSAFEFDLKTAIRLSIMEAAVDTKASCRRMPLSPRRKTKAFYWTSDEDNSSDDDDDEDVKYKTRTDIKVENIKSSVKTSSNQDVKPKRNVKPKMEPSDDNSSDDDEDVKYKTRADNIKVENIKSSVKTSLNQDVKPKRLVKPKMEPRTTTARTTAFYSLDVKPAATHVKSKTELSAKVAKAFRFGDDDSEYEDVKHIAEDVKPKPTRDRLVWANSSDEEDDIKPVAQRKTTKTTKKSSTTTNKYDLSDDSGDDQSVDYQEDELKDLTNETLVETSDNSDSDDEVETQKEVVLPPLTNEQKQTMLADIHNLEDKAYQALLWKLEFRYKLLAHQFEGSRAVAGVPSNFPLQGRIKVQDPTQITIEAAIRGLDEEPETRGLLLADDMGLGKTIQAISGALIHSAIRQATKKPVLPTLIVCPNVALIEQWHEELDKNGVTSSKILWVKSRKQLGSIVFLKPSFVFMTRYTLQTECKDILTQCGDPSVQNKKRQQSSLFPGIKSHFLEKLWRLKRMTKGKEANNLRLDGESYDDCLTRIVKNYTKHNKDHIRPAFGVVVIDEAHFLKNRVSFWGIGASLLGTHAMRTITMSGTPYCNHSSDVAALQSYIDLEHPAAKSNWWERATNASATSSFAAEVSQWRKQYLVRRRKEVILKDVLPVKTITDVQVQVYPQELVVYEEIEKRLLDMMGRYGEGTGQQDNELKDIMMAFMTLARGCLVHPMLPNGREITIQFSPSRRHLAAQHVSTDSCVYCNQLMRPTVPLDNSVDNDDEEGLRGQRVPLLDLDLDDPDVNDDEDRGRARKQKNSRKGKLIKFPHKFCCKNEDDSKMGHFIHTQCLASFRAGGAARCPRCVDLENRMSLSNNLGQAVVPHQRYCKHIRTSPHAEGGFVASSKLEKVLAGFAEVPKGEKVLVLSFFKGALDLLEGIFVEDMDLECARYDGDMKHEDRRTELHKFKNKESCRILLATVHCCGTGLNIVEANHVFFVDRWFNPTVHDQAMDRCYRIGQEKDVSVQFFDCIGTIDIGMMLTNKYKKENSAILLADGSELGEGAMNFRQLNGVMKGILTALGAERRGHVETLGRETPFVEVEPSRMQVFLDNVTAMLNNKRSSQNGWIDTRTNENK